MCFVLRLTPYELTSYKTMFDLTIIDYIYIGVLLASTVWASIRGGVYETVTMMAWVVAALVSRFASPYLNEVFQSWFGLAEPTIGTLVAAYFIVFFVILLLFSMFNQRLRWSVQQSMMSLTDHTFGIVFGLVRGVVVMGFVYWGMLWYYSDGPLPSFMSDARSRPLMQLTAVKMHQWFIPGENKLLDDDMTGEHSAQEVYENLINPMVKRKDTDEHEINLDPDALPSSENIGTGYRDSERDSLENKLLQLENVLEQDQTE